MSTTTTQQDQFTDAERMEVRSYVNLAGEVVTRLWPMRTFISRNPLQGLEHLRFGEAVLKGEQLFSGNGYLSEALYREEFQKGHIHLHDLNRVLQPLASDKRVRFGDRELTHLDVLRTALIHELYAVGKVPGTTQPESTSRESGDVTTPVQQWLEQTQPSDMWNQLLEGPVAL